MRILCRGAHQLEDYTLISSLNLDDTAVILFLTMKFPCNCWGTYNLPVASERAPQQLPRSVERTPERGVRSLEEGGVTPLLVYENQVRVELRGVGELHFQLGRKSPFEAPRMGVVATRGVFVHPHARCGGIVELPEHFNSYSPVISLLQLLEMVESLIAEPQAELLWEYETAPYASEMRDGLDAWTTRLHRFFPPMARSLIRMFLLVLQRLQVKLPPDVRHLLCLWIVSDRVGELMKAAVTYSPLD